MLLCPSLLDPGLLKRHERFSKWVIRSRFSHTEQSCSFRPHFNTHESKQQQDDLAMLIYIYIFFLNLMRLLDSEVISWNSAFISYDSEFILQFKFFYLAIMILRKKSQNCEEQCQNLKTFFY